MTTRHVNSQSSEGQPPFTNSKPEEITPVQHVPFVTAQPEALRFGDVVGARINSFSDKASELSRRANERLKTIGSVAVKPFISVGDRAGSVVDGLNDRLTEWQHATVDNAVLRSEKRQNRTSIRQWVEGISEIKSATKGMRSSEKAKFGEELTKLEHASKLDATEQSAISAMSRADARSVERNRRRGGSYAAMGKRIDHENIKARYTTESKRIDASANSKFNRQLNRLNRAQKREERINNTKSTILGASKQAGFHTGRTLKSVADRIEDTKSRAQQTKNAATNMVNQTRRTAGNKLDQANEAVTSRSKEIANLAKEIVASSLYRHAEKQLERSVRADSRGLTNVANRNLERSARTESRAVRVASTRR